MNLMKTYVIVSAHNLSVKIQMFTCADQIQLLNDQSRQNINYIKFLLIKAELYL